MGLFSRDEIITVASVIYPLGEEPDKIPDLLKAAVIRSGIQGTSRPEAIVKTVFDGGGIKLRQGYQYASRHYYIGLPQGITATNGDNDDLLLEMLCEEFLAGEYPTNDVDVIGVAVTHGSNFDTIARQQIEADYNYDFHAGGVHTAFGSVAFDAELAYEPIAADPIGHPGDYGYQLTFTNPDTSEVVITAWFDGDLFVNEDLVENRIVMVVSLDAGPAFTLSYAYGGGDARLNVFLRQLETPTSGTFPALVIKKNNKYLNTDDFLDEPWQTSDAYITTKSYARRLGLNVDDLLEMVENNPDEHKIDYAFVQPGTKINSPNQPVIEYHFNYFNRLRLVFPDNKPAFDAYRAASEHPPHSHVSMEKALNCPAQSFRIKDPDIAKQSVNMEIAWRYMTYEEKSGTLTDAYEIECGPQDLLTVRYTFVKGYRTVDYDCTKLFLRKRLNDTTYAELMVAGLWHENYIYKGHSVQSGVWDAFNDPEGDFGTGFLIPLEYEVFVSLTERERLQLSQEAMHIIFNCYKVQKEPWYATGFFKFVLMVVAIVITVYSFGSMSGLVGGIYDAIYIALPIGISATLAFALAAILTSLVIGAMYAGVSYVAKEAGEWAAEHWGPAWGAVVQIATTIVLSYGIGMGLKGIGMNIPPTPLIQQVGNAASYVLAGLSSYTEMQMVELQEAQKEWHDYVSSPDNPLEQVNDLLEEMFPDMTLTQQAFFAPRESMDEFLGRTLSLVDSLTNRLTLPISHLSELTLTPRLS